MNKARELVRYGRKRLEVFGANLDRALTEGDTESVHNLRVCSRRLTEPLLLTADFIESTQVNKARRGLKKVRRAFRDARDLDVLLISLSSEASSKSSRALHPGALARLDGIITSLRDKALNRAVRECEGVDLKRVVRRVESVFKAFQREADRESTDNVMDRLAAMCRLYLSDLVEKSPSHSQSPNLHQTRLCVKRMRYCSELIARLGREEYEAAVAALKEIQDLLGRWNDHLFASRQVAQLASDPDQLSHEPGWSAAALSYASQRASEAEEERATILQRWPKFQAELERIVVGSSGAPHSEILRLTQTASSN